MKTETQISIKELQPLLRIVELNREIGLKLQSIRLNQERTNKALQDVLVLARELSINKGQFGNCKELKTLESLSIEDRKKINQMLRTRFIGLQI